MKSIRRVIRQNHLVVMLLTSMFIVVNILVYTATYSTYQKLLRDYQEINELFTINNDRKTSFTLYSKSHDDGALQQYYDSSARLEKGLEKLEGKMQGDLECKMLYRILCQVMDYRFEMAESYIQPGKAYNPGILEELDEVDLTTDRCLNQLVSRYLEYLNTSFGEFSRRMNSVNIVLNLALIGGCLFSLLLNYYMNRRVLFSIEDLTRAAQEITSKNFEAEDIRKTSFEELNQVSGAFDQMKHTIRNMITELNETHQMKERLAEAKIRELQMQMNPHFLFNTLSLVIRSIQLGERDTSIQLVKAISKILRSSIEIKTTSIPLDDEIELLQAYLYIQKLHLKGRITFCLDVRKSFLENAFQIPPLTIQPLVENSIQHGLKDRVSGGKVDILITEKPDYMEVVVADNGVGFPEHGEREPEHEDGLQKQNSREGRGQTVITRTSIGLNNVRERLELFYRKEDVLQIERIDGITKITLKLYKTEDDRQKRQEENVCCE
jgi:sensor histidine kinase YesM